MQLIEDLRKELEHLQMYKLDCERPGRGRSSSSGLGEFNARAREVELEHEVKRLKQVGPAGRVSRMGPQAAAAPSHTPSCLLLSTSLPGGAARPHPTAQARQLTSRPHLMRIPGSLLGVHTKKQTPLCCPCRWSGGGDYPAMDEGLLCWVLPEADPDPKVPFQMVPGSTPTMGELGEVGSGGAGTKGGCDGE